MDLDLDGVMKQAGKGSKRGKLGQRTSELEDTVVEVAVQCSNECILVRYNLQRPRLAMARGYRRRTCPSFNASIGLQKSSSLGGNKQPLCCARNTQKINARLWVVPNPNPFGDQ